MASPRATVKGTTTPLPDLAKPVRTCKLCSEPRFQRSTLCRSHTLERRRVRPQSRPGPKVPKGCRACGKPCNRLTKYGRAGYCSKLCFATKPETKKQQQKRLGLESLDRLAGALCRAEGACAAAGHDYIECSSGFQWAHILSRSYHRTRYWLSNCICLCSAHHTFYTFHTAHWERFRDAGLGRCTEYLRVRRYALDPLSPKLDREATFNALVKGQWPIEPDTLFDVPEVPA